MYDTHFQTDNNFCAYFSDSAIFLLLLLLVSNTYWLQYFSLKVIIIEIFCAFSQGKYRKRACLKTFWLYILLASMENGTFLAILILITVRQCLSSKPAEPARAKRKLWNPILSMDNN
jgi:hypothetical protein